MNVTLNGTQDNIFPPPNSGYLSWSPPNIEANKVDFGEKVSLLALVVVLVIVILLRYRISTSYLDGLMRKNRTLELDEYQVNGQHQKLYTT